MLEKIMAKLGYIPKFKYEQIKTVLKDTTTGYEKLSKTLNESSKKINLLEEQLKSSNALNEIQVKEIDFYKKWISDVEKKISKLEKSLKKAKSKENTLLRKQGKFKEEISEKEEIISHLHREINYLNQKVKLLESYNYAVITKLEELCFGSVLPKVMKQMDLSKYRYPLKPIEIVWSNPNGDIKVEAVGIEDKK